MRNRPDFDDFIDDFKFCGDECERDVDNVPISEPPECFQTENRTMPHIGTFRILDGTWGPSDGVFTRSDRLVRIGASGRGRPTDRWSDYPEKGFLISKMIQGKKKMYLMIIHML